VFYYVLTWYHGHVLLDKYRYVMLHIIWYVLCNKYNV